MKICILLIVVYFAATEAALDMIADLVNLDQTCRKESGLTEEEFGDLIDLSVAPSAKCYLKCVFSQFGIWNKGLDVKAFMSKVRKVPLLSFISGKIQKVLDQCTDVTGEDECEQAFNVAICLAASIYKDYGKVLRGAYKVAKG